MLLKKTLLEALGKPKCILSILLLGIFIFCLSSISAFDWSQNNLVGFWDFREGTGTTANDIGMGRHPGTLSGDATWVTGKLSNGTYTRGYGSVNVSHSSNLNIIGNISIQAWVRPNVSQVWNPILSKTYHLWLGANGMIDFRIKDAATLGWVAVQTDSGAAMPNQWTHIVGTMNDTALSVYINGVLNKTVDATAKTITTNTNYLTIGFSADAGNFYYNGSLDEIGIWNKTLNTSEVRDLYGNSYGLAFNSSFAGGTFGITTSLTSPANTITLATDGSNFSASYLTSGYNLSNGSYYVYASNGTLVNKTTVSVTGTSNTSIQFIDDFSIGTYYWNVFACGDNSTGTKCSFATTNYSFSVGVVSINNTYSTSAFETSYETFVNSISYDSSADTIVASYLVYNGSSYSASITGTGDQLTFTKSIDIPTGVGNKSFYWHSVFYSGTTYNSPSYYQYVDLLNMTGTCSATTTIQSVNYTAYSETYLTMLSPFKFDSTIYYWLGLGTTRKNFSISNSTTTDQYLCIESINRTLYMDGIISYDNQTSGGFIPRSYYIYNETLTNITRHVKLYLLETSLSTSFIQKVLDRNLVAVRDAYIYTYRYYPGTNEFKLIQSSKTDDNGKTIGFYKIETVDYKHLIYKNGVLELETNVSKVVPEETPYTLTFTIGSAYQIPWSSFDESSTIQTSLTFNNNTKIVTYQYSDSDSSISGGRLLVTIDRASMAELVICNTSISGIFGTITCNTTGYNGTAIARGYIDDVLHKTISFYVGTSSDIEDVFGLEGLLLAVFLIITSFFAFIWNPTAGIIMTNITVILIRVIGIASFSPVWIFGLLAVSVTLIILMEN